MGGRPDSTAARLRRVAFEGSNERFEDAGSLLMHGRGIGADGAVGLQLTAAFQIILKS